MALVSYDLAVREEDRPADDAAAGQEYRRLYDRYIGSRDLQPPTPRIAVDRLVCYDPQLERLRP